MSEAGRKTLQDLSETTYDSFVARTRQLFEASKEQSRDALEKAMDRAREQMIGAGEFTAEQGAAFRRFLIRDMEHAAEYMRHVGEEAKERLNPSRVGAGALASLTTLLHSTGEALLSLSKRTDQALDYATGEVTGAGTLTCTSCGKTIHLKHTHLIPPCRGCNGTRFKKGY